jgi:predicted O-methyltransferase YrrM
MDSIVAAVLTEYNERHSEEFDVIFPTLSPEEVLARRDDMLMSIGHEAGLFLNLLIASAGSGRILELGTSYGHSTVYLAEAAKRTGGRVVTCDHSKRKQDFAREMLTRAGLHEHVEFETGDAVDVIQGLRGEVDFCLIDLWTAAYIPAFDALHGKLADGAIVVADNMVTPNTAEAKDYRRFVRSKPDMESILLPIGWGLEVSRRISA